MYAYRCNACDLDVEIMHSMDSVQPWVCHKCGVPMARQLTAPKGVRITSPALNSVTGKPFDGGKTKTSVYTQSGKS